MEERQAGKKDGENNMQLRSSTKWRIVLDLVLHAEYLHGPVVQSSRSKKMKFQERALMRLGVAWERGKKEEIIHGRRAGQMEAEAAGSSSSLVEYIR